MHAGTRSAPSHAVRGQVSRDPRRQTCKHTHMEDPSAHLDKTTITGALHVQCMHICQLCMHPSQACPMGCHASIAGALHVQCMHICQLCLKHALWAVMPLLQGHCMSSAWILGQEVVVAISCMLLRWFRVLHVTVSCPGAPDTVVSSITEVI